MELIYTDINGRDYWEGVPGETEPTTSITGSMIFYSDGSTKRRTSTQWVNGAASVTSPAATYVEYENTTYKYYCEAPVGTALSDSAWQVMRKTLADNTIIFAGTGAFEHAATNLAAVAALTYTLGA